MTSEPRETHVPVFYRLSSEEQPPADGRTPSVTIVTPLYRAAKHLDSMFEQLDSLEFGDFEVVLYLDGPDSESEAIIRAKANTYPVFVIAGNSQVGAGEARNRALQFAKGHYVWFIDADDRWPASALSQLHTAATEYSADLVIGGATRRIVRSNEVERVRIPEAKLLNQDELFRELLLGNVEGYLWNKLIRRSIISADPFPRIRTKSDYCGVIAICSEVALAVTVTENVYEYLFQPGSVSSASIATPLDTFRVLEAAERATEGSSATTSEKWLLTAFAVSFVARVSFAEVWRYGDKALGGKLATAYCRGLLSMRALTRLAIAGRFGLAAQGFGFRFAAKPMRAIYLKRRSQRWK